MEPDEQSRQEKTIDAGFETIFEEAQKKLVPKSQVERFERYIDVQNQLIQANPSLVTGKNDKERTESFRRLAAHAEQLWQDGLRLFFAGSYASALFMSIVCIEETGKIGVTLMQMRMSEMAGTAFSSQMVTPIKRHRNPFYQHRDKHFLAASAGALINARLDRILGMDKVIEFFNDVENGEVERLRQSCIYVDYDGSNAILPIDQVTEDKAKLYLILSGEILAETLGHPPEEWERLLLIVDDFERKVGVSV